MPHQCTTCDRTFPDGSKEMLSGCPDCGGNKFQFAPSLETRSSAGDESRSDRSEPTSDVDGAASPFDDSGTPTGTSSDVEDGSVGSRGREPPRGSNSTDRSRDRRKRTHPSEWGRDEGREWPESGRRPEDRSSSRSEDRSTPRFEDRPRSGSENGPDAGPIDPDSGSGESSPSDPEVVDREDTAQATARSDVVSTDELPPADELPPIDAADRPDPERGRVVSEPAEDQPSLDELREELNQQFESIKIVNPGQYELNLMELYNRDEYIISLQEDGRYVIDVPDSWRQNEE